MVLEQFLVMLGVNADTEKVKSFGAALSKVAVIGTAVVGALKAVTVTAWAFADSYVRRAEELYKANDGLVQVTKEQVEMSKKYQEGMEKLGKTVEGVKTKIAFGFLPTMLELVDSFNKFLDANKDLIANGVTITLNAISKLSQVINNTVRFIDKIISATIGWKAALFLIAAAFVYLKRAMLLAFVTNPIFWVIAAIGVLMLLIDDFMTYLDGGESQFGAFWGSMIEWIDKVKPSLQAIWDMLVLGMSYLIEFGVHITKYLGGAFVDAVEAITAIWALLVGLFSGDTELMKAAWQGLIENLISIFNNFAMIFDPLVRFIVSLFVSAWESIVQAVSAAMETVAGVFSEAWNDTKASLSAAMASMIASFKGFVSGIGSALSNVFDIVTAPFAKAFDWIANKFGTLGGIISGAVGGAKSLFSAGGASAASNSSVITGSNMTINAPISVSSNDPKRAGAAAGDSLNMVANSAFRNMGTRVKA